MTIATHAERTVFRVSEHPFCDCAHVEIVAPLQQAGQSSAPVAIIQLHEQHRTNPIPTLGRIVVAAVQEAGKERQILANEPCGIAKFAPVNPGGGLQVVTVILQDLIAIDGGVWGDPGWLHSTKWAIKCGES